MLGKLMKHEFIATWKVFVLLDVVLILAGIIAGLVAYNLPLFEEWPDPLIAVLTLGFFGFIFLLVACVVLTFVYIVVRYYKSLYTHEGYLTFTLPATTTEVLSSKMITSMIWQILCALSLFLGLIALAIGFIGLGSRAGDIDMGPLYAEVYSNFCDMFGFDNIGRLVLYLVSCIAGMAFNLLTFFLAITLGQLWQQHKVLGSVIFYFMIRFVLGIIGLFVTLGSGTFRMLLDNVDLSSAEYFQRVFSQGLVSNLILGTIFYFLCIFVTNRRLNLD